MNQAISESDITCHWQSKDILVSVICTCYNHSKFIEQTIQGFLIQKTDFPFEIIIHDDASTDGSALILTDYQCKYPNLIKLILQKDNKYSKGEMILLDYIAPECHGNFIAICEGDDYWIDERKLQKQINVMKNFKDCLISFHPTIGLRNGGQEKIIAYHGEKEKVIPVGDVICGGGGYMPTASIVFHQSILTHLSEFYHRYPNPPIGDVILQVIGSLPNGAVYFPDKASVYRIFANGSWSLRMQTDRTFAENNVLGLFRINRILDEYSNFRYTKQIMQSNLLLLDAYAFNPYFSKFFREKLLRDYSSKKIGKFYVFYKNLRNRLRMCIKQILGYAT